MSFSPHGVSCCSARVCVYRYIHTYTRIYTQYVCKRVCLYTCQYAPCCQHKYRESRCLCVSWRTFATEPRIPRDFDARTKYHAATFVFTFVLSRKSLYGVIPPVLWTSHVIFLFFFWTHNAKRWTNEYSHEYLSRRTSPRSNFTDPRYLSNLRIERSLHARGLDNRETNNRKQAA